MAVAKEQIRQIISENSISTVADVYSSHFLSPIKSAIFPPILLTEDLRSRYVRFTQEKRKSA